MDWICWRIGGRMGVGIYRVFIGNWWLVKGKEGRKECGRFDGRVSFG